MERETESGPDTANDVAVLPEWKAFAREFPQWYVWRGVAGQYYARVPRTSPPRPSTWAVASTGLAGLP